MDSTRSRDCQLVCESKWAGESSEGMLYNPVNMKIEDDKRLYERDLREKNKKKRYEVRFDMEREYHVRVDNQLGTECD